VPLPLVIAVSKEVNDMDNMKSAIAEYVNAIRSSVVLLGTISECELKIYERHDRMPEIIHRYKKEIFRSLNSLADLIEMTLDNNRDNIYYLLQSHHEILESVESLNLELTYCLNKYLDSDEGHS